MAEAPDLTNLPEVLREEIEGLTQADRAAVLLLLLGEEEAANILKYMNPAEVQRLGGAMVGAADLSQEAINYVLDEHKIDKDRSKTSKFQNEVYRHTGLSSSHNVLLPERLYG